MYTRPTLIASVYFSYCVCARVRACVRACSFLYYALQHIEEYCNNCSESGINDDSDGQIRGYVQKFPDWVDNEIYAYNNKHSLRSNTKGYGGKTH
jgi:hypothetical protein